MHCKRGEPHEILIMKRKMVKRERIFRWLYRIALADTYKSHVCRSMNPRSVRKATDRPICTKKKITKMKMKMIGGTAMRNTSAEFDH